MAGINFERDCTCTEVYVSWKYSKTIHMNLFFYLQTFILNYSFIVILSDRVLYFVLLKHNPLENGNLWKRKKNTGTIAFRFRQVLLYT
jgi:hypothetical protein